MAEDGSLYAVVMLKGTVKINKEVVDTLKRFRLSSSNSCVVVPADSMYRGMLKKVSEYVTWGELDENVLERMLSLRGGADKKKAKSAASKAFKEKRLEEGRGFRLSPPSGGLKAVRLNYPKGDVGYRGAEINRLLMRMI